MTDIEKKDFIKSLITIKQERVGADKKILLREPTSGYSMFLDIESTEEDIENAKDQIVNNVLKMFDVVEDDSGIKSLQIKEF